MSDAEHRKAELEAKHDAALVALLDAQEALIESLRPLTPEQEVAVRNILRLGRRH